MTLPLAKTPVILIVCLIGLALGLLCLALATHWLIPATHLPAGLGFIPHPYGCGNGSGPC
jgi:hypothetical protein